MKLYGRKTSINVQKVRWLLEELGMAHELQELGGAFGGLDTAEFAALNPNKLVPVLVDGDLVLWESNAILRYLARHHSKGAVEGRSAAEIAQADMWMEWFQSTAFAPLTAVFYQTVRLPRADRDPGTCAAAVQRLNSAYQLLDQQLEGRDFLVAERLTLGDIVVGSSLYRYFTMAFDRPALPALEAYYDRLQQRPAYVEGVMVSYESLRAKES
ncbi:glutathione S-transferase family protein [Tritonibacter horizontis]|uniref:Glutathione S-transferase GstB n=1 Tax=Tritonibacter horizontis TaxID=1768241 RepID=A0A132C1Q9_9RHOB|nr:glutathione S-transferase family protein [Tritonibacter horizontis]KUP94503.1 glutathione S-transferase GstB [Tritonibacter horizontis]